jgi:pyruvate/2-oxoglutarate/acetoin dehydrogenase E1 component
MAGLSLGLAIENFKPVLIFERHDFMLNALDSLVNHFDKIRDLSNGDYTPSGIIRAIVGSEHPINPGPQHKQDFTKALREMVDMPIYDPSNPTEVLEAYQKGLVADGPVMVVERRDLYGLE